MKNCILTFTILFTLDTYGQKTVVQDLKNVNTIEEAKNYKLKNASQKPELLYLNSTTDTSILNKQLFAALKGDIITNKGFVYKIIDKTTTSSYRASYIYLDASKLDLAKIDSIRQLIILKYKTGTSFSTLFQQYNMDGNPNQGDTDYFEKGQMVMEFEDAIKVHNTGDIFKVDVPAYGWYYIVKKTHPDRTTSKITVLKVKNNS